MGLRRFAALERCARLGGKITVGGVEAYGGGGDFRDAPDVGVEVGEEGGGGGEGGFHFFFFFREGTLFFSFGWMRWYWT